MIIFFPYATLCRKLCFADPGPDYRFNMLIIWRTPNERLHNRTVSSLIDYGLRITVLNQFPGIKTTQNIRCDRNKIGE